MLAVAESKIKKKVERVVLSHQVIGMFPGKDGQAPFVTCAAKVIAVVDNLPHSSTCHPRVISAPFHIHVIKVAFPPCPLHHLSVFIFSFLLH